MLKYVERTALGVDTSIHHILQVPICCPVSKNPCSGSTLMVSYRPASVVVPVEMLADMLAEYVDGHVERGIRGMEEMIQDIAQRCSTTIKRPVLIRADLIIQPPFGGDKQRMIVSARARVP